MIYSSKFSFYGCSLEKSWLSRVSTDCLLNKKDIFWFENTNKKGWCHHATSPFLVYKIFNSNSILSKNSQSPRGSQAMEMCRTWSQHCLQTMNNLLFLWIWRNGVNTQWVPEKGKEGKLSVARNGNLREKNETSLRSFLTVQLCCNQPVWPCITNKLPLCCNQPV